MTSLNVQIDSHPLLDLRLLHSEFPAPLGDTPTDPQILRWLSQAEDAPLKATDEVRAKVRDLLRVGGFKPTGRSKPASEYLRKAHEKQSLGSINPAVDVGNAVSLHSGVPISVIDVDRTLTPLRVGIAESGAAYVFNRSLQVIDVGGLLCLFDGEGPCANAVKDSQRTKTDETSRQTLTILWGTRELPEQVEQAVAWSLELLRLTGAATTVVAS